MIKSSVVKTAKADNGAVFIIGEMSFLDETLVKGAKTVLAK